MQGKDAPEQEPSVKCSVGIDVGKDWLDVHILPGEERLRVSNCATGVRQLKSWLRRFDVTSILVEATGKWHRAVHRSLFAAGFAVSAVDPFQVRMFAKAQRLLAKTDRLDARVLALFGAVMNPMLRPPAPEAIEALQELVRARDSAVAEQTALRNQLGEASDGFLVRQLKRRIARIGKDIAALERESLARIKADAGLARRHEILTSVPGFGDVVAAILIACLAELGTLSAKQIALLAGLAPIADDSGQRQGVRVVWSGRGSVRRALYLAALSAARHGTDLKTFYKRLRANGKAAKQALIAVARKLVVLANTLISQDRIWQPTPPQHA